MVVEEGMGPMWLVAEMEVMEEYGSIMQIWLDNGLATPVHSQWKKRFRYTSIKTCILTFET